MSIFDWLGLGSRSSSPARSGPTGDTETVRRIVERLDELEPERARFIAAFAYVLSRVARADMHVSAAETMAMERVVSAKGDLPEEQAVLIVQMAKSQNLLFGGTENFLVTRELNRIASREQKLALVDCLYAVSAADGAISAVEDNVILQIADELKLDRPERIAVRARYRDHLAVLRKAPDDQG